MNVFLETTHCIYSENGLPAPEKFYAGLTIQRGSDLNTLLKTKEIVLKSEEMIRNWLYSFQEVSFSLIT